MSDLEGPRDSGEFEPETREWTTWENRADVFFTRPSDRALKDLLLVASLLSIFGIYLMGRIRIGLKLQDKHLVDFRNIVLNRQA